MQVMEPDAAPAGFKNRMSKKMIHIYQHRPEQDEPVSLPVFPVVPVGYSANEDEVEEIMEESLKQKVQSLKFKVRDCSLGKS